jgi:hypothetical protein
MVVGIIESGGSAVTPGALAGASVDSVTGFGESPEAQANNTSEKDANAAPAKRAPPLREKIRVMNSPDYLMYY